jgi:hypothetical protein
MNEHKGNNVNGNRPATKSDLKALESKMAIRKDLKKLREDLKSDMKSLRKNLPEIVKSAMEEVIIDEMTRISEEVKNERTEATDHKDLIIKKFDQFLTETAAIKANYKHLERRTKRLEEKIS